MRLQSVILKDFRQFYGQQVVEFAKNKEKNITVIHGENGAGKTAFLNALLWCLYNEINLEQPDVLLNERTQAETKPGAPVEIFVKLHFQKDDKDYFVTRTVTGKIGDNKKLKDRLDNLSVRYVDPDGNSRPVQNGQNLINQILPKSLNSYFFFDGERLDKLSAEQDLIENAVKNIMGLTVIERSISHLRAVSKDFTKEVKQYADSKLAQFLERKEEQEEIIEKEESSIKTLRDNIASNNKHLDEIEKKLKTLEKTSDLQKLRNSKEQEEKKERERRKKLLVDIRAIISQNAYVAFAEDIAEEAITILDKHREKGEIPSGIKQQFVDDILKLEKCICGRELKEGTEPFLAVASWKKRASSQQVEDLCFHTRVYCDSVKKKKEKFFQELTAKRDELAYSSREIKRLKEEIDEIGSELSAFDSEEVTSLEDKRNTLLGSNNRMHEAIGQCDEKIKNTRTELGKVEKEIAKHEKLNTKGRLAKRRAAAADSAVEALEKINQSVAEHVKGTLQQRTSEIFGHFARKQYSAEINDRFGLEIYKEADGEKKRVPMGQGERTISSLCFIGAIVDIARQQYNREKKSYFSFTGGLYPLVMDSPFGYLDPDHRKRVASGIPSLADQLVVLVTESQWSSEVSKGMEGSVGKAYQLDNFSPTRDKSTKSEYTIIREVK